MKKFKGISAETKKHTAKIMAEAPKKKPPTKPPTKASLKAAAKKVIQSEESESQSSSDVKSISGSQSNQSDASSEELQLITQGSYIALVDPSDEEGGFRIGYVIEDQADPTSDVIIDLFQQKGSSLTYELAEKKVAVAEYCIICEIDVTVPKNAKAKFGSVAQPSTLQITKQNFNSTSELMPHIISGLKDIEADSDESEEEQEVDESEQENDEEEEEEEDKDAEKSESSDDSEEVINQRRTVSAKRVIQTASNKTGKPVKKAAGISKSVGKSVPSVTGSRRGSQRHQVSKSKAIDQEDEKSEDDEEMEDENVVNTVSKKKPQAKKPAEKIGQKRQRKASGKGAKNVDLDEEKNDDEGNDDEDMSEDEGFQVIKKRKVSKSKEKPVKQKKAPKAKKVKVPKQKRVAVPKGRKMPTEFKKGKWNPDMVVLDIDKAKEDPSNECINDCCIRCNSRNVIRAAITKNKKLLQNCMDSNKQVSLLTAYWSPEVEQTALEYMIGNNDHEMLEKFLHPSNVKAKSHSPYEQERSAYYSRRVTNPQYLLNFVDSGMVSQMAYGTKVRKVQMTRGNRQGNNAFLQYTDNPQSDPINALADQTLLTKIIQNPNVTLETFKVLIKLNPNIQGTLNGLFHEVVKAGNKELASHLVKDMVKLQNYGFNNLHMEVLGKSIDQAKILKVSVVKKANSNADITPLHCACINPNPNILKQLLDINNKETDVFDAQLRRPVHYAAACISPEPLKLLIEAGAVLNVNDNLGLNCLHIAAKLGRAENIRAILTAMPTLLNVKTKKEGMNAIAYASKFGHVEAVKVLISFKAKVNVGVGIDRMSPICWASAYGHYELVEALLGLKGNVLSKDKFGRNPLILAVRNGHSKLASLLLKHGAEWDSTDSSHNSALHYAAAYGQHECIDILLKAGANVNIQNSWKITPINIAMLKNHQGCVKRFLDEHDVDVNCKDEKGRTLLMLSVVDLGPESKSFVKYLLKKGADPNIADLYGLTALHYIAKQVITQQQAQQFYGYNYMQKSQEECKAEFDTKVEVQIHIANLLIEFNADLSLKNLEGKTPFTLCLENDNAPLLNLLKNKISLNGEPTILFSFISKIFNVQFQKILLEIIENDPPSVATMNVLDAQGLTPFLSYIEAYTLQAANLQQQIRQHINQQSFTHGAKMNLYKLTNEQLFDKFAILTNASQLNYNIDAGLIQGVIDKLFQDVIVKPFLKILKKLISKGADPQAVVGKLQTVRDEEEKQRKLEAELLANGPKKELEEEKVNKRNEYIGVPVDLGSLMNHFNQHPLNNLAVATPSIFQSMLLPQQQQNGGKAGAKDKKKAQREYSSIGLQNAIHLSVSCPTKEVIDFLIDLKIDPDQPDYDQETPFFVLSKAYSGTAEQVQLKQRLIGLDVRVDFPNYKGRTPFLNYYERSLTDIAYELLDQGANVNQMDKGGLFALKYDLIRRNMDGITKLLERGANINQIDNRGRNLLHHAVNMSSATADATFETEQFLIDQGVELNLRDCRGRTPLHYAFVKIKDWQSSDPIDPIETVSSLCGCKGLEMDVPDKWMKTPLHYASQRAASCCAMYLIKLGAQTESKDIYSNTPLGVAMLNNHHNYGILMIQKDCDVNDPVYAEKPEELALKWKKEKKIAKKLAKKLANGHQENGDVEMKDEELNGEKKKKKKKKVSKKHRDMFQMHVNEDYGDEEYGDEYGEEQDEEKFEDDSEDSDDDSDESHESDKQHHDNVFNQQNAFGNQVFQPPPGFGRRRGGRKAPRKQLASMAAQKSYGGYPGAATGGLFGYKSPCNYATGPSKSTYRQPGPVRKDEAEGCSLFKLAIRAGQQGLAYLMMNSGYDLMLCIQDAMDEKKFLLVLTLLSKTADDKIVQQKNNKDQNLIHILSLNSAGCQYDILKRIFTALNKRGVDGSVKDKFDRTALHYAVLSERQDLVNLLLSEDDKHKFDVNAADSVGHTPLTLLLKGNKVTKAFSNEPQFIQAIPQKTGGKGYQPVGQQYNGVGGLFGVGGMFGASQPALQQVPIQQNLSIFDILIQNGADVNVTYPEETWKPAFKSSELKNTKHGDGYSELKPYKCTIFTNLIRHGVTRDDTTAFTAYLNQNITKLIQSGAKIDIQDTDGRDSLIYSIIENDIDCIRLLMNNKKAREHNETNQDSLGKSAAHYVVTPLKFGSYENEEILRLLNENKYELNLKDNNGRTPLSYAKEQKSGLLMKRLNQLLKIKADQNDEEMLALQRQSSIIKSVDWHKSQVDYVADSELFMQIAKEKEEKDHNKKNKVPVDNTGHFESSYEVYYGPINSTDEEEGKVRPWDHYMIKVDLKNGVYGDYVFYRMQLLHDRNRDLYVVFTRWGRIGEAGMNQRTPFNNIEEAKEDYKKIFKSKSANALEEVDNFVKVKNKYNITKINYVTTDYKEYLLPFDFEKCHKSMINEEVYHLFEEISNITMYQRAMTSLGLNYNALPVSGIKKESLLEAQDLLGEIGIAVKEMIKIQAEGIKANYEELMAVKDKISELSSAFYELIPLTQYANSIAPPISTQAQIKAQFDSIQSLTYIEQASKMLLAALYRQKEMNPIDYIFESLNMKIEPLDEESGEYELMFKYIENTSGQLLVQQNKEVVNIFKIQRKGEAEEMENFSRDIANRTLLFHGSQISNFLGIMSQGLKIAPPEAPPTGHLLGKGVYFGDMFEKGDQYAYRQYGAQDSQLIMMCEVALGKSKEVDKPELIDDLEPRYQSVKGLGRRSPNPAKNVILPNGIKVPYGKPIENEHPDRANINQLNNWGFYNAHWNFQHNEYVVYNTSQVRMRYLIQVKQKKAAI